MIELASGQVSILITSGSTGFPNGFDESGANASVRRGGVGMSDPGLRALALRTILASFPGSRPPEWATRLLGDGLAGYVLFGVNGVARGQLAGLVGALRNARPDVIVGIDEEGGDVTRLAHAEGSPFPGNAALGAVDDPELTRQVYAAIGGPLHEGGVPLDPAPAVDANTVHGNPIIAPRPFASHPPPGA